MSHDIIEVGDCSVRCRRGVAFVASSLAKAKVDHGYHFGIEQARTALRGGVVSGHTKDTAPPVKKAP